MNFRSRTLTALPIALAFVAATPVAAQAEDIAHFVEYSADTKVVVRHFVTQHRAAGDTTWDRGVDSISTVRSHHPQLTFQNDEKVQLLSGVTAKAHAANEGLVTARLRSPQGSETETCAPVDNDWDYSDIEPSVLEPLGTGTELSFSIGDSPRPKWSCSGPHVDADPTALFDYEGDKPEGFGPWDATFAVTKEEMGMGKILYKVDGPPAASKGFCPGMKAPWLTFCGFTWSGWITLVKTGETVVESEPGAETDPGTPPAQPGSGTPAGSGAQQPSGTGADDDRPRASAPKVNPKTGDVTFSAVCPKGCVGAATVTVPKSVAGRISASAAPKPLATLRFAVKAGKKSTVRLRLPARAKKAMRRAGRATMKVTLTPKGGKASTRTFAMKVRKR